MFVLFQVLRDVSLLRLPLLEELFKCLCLSSGLIYFLVCLTLISTRILSPALVCKLTESRLYALLMSIFLSWHLVSVSLDG